MVLPEPAGVQAKPGVNRKASGCLYFIQEMDKPPEIRAGSTRRVPEFSGEITLMN
jgi:hypothetical protein